jgi:ParB family chromosome partitioning protein
VKSGEWYALGEHRLYCGDTGKTDFWEHLPHSVFAFADPPYNAGVDEWDEDFEWRHDWLSEKADVVAVTPGIESVKRFYADDTQMPYVWSMASWITNGMTRGALGFGNWIYIGIFANGEVSLHKKHRGRKPSELMDRLIELFTQYGDVAIDPFLGSGTTLFSAERLGRICYGGEISPDFCNDIISRWQDMTGVAAERIGVSGEHAGH